MAYDLNRSAKKRCLPVHAVRESEDSTEAQADLG